MSSSIGSELTSTFQIKELTGDQRTLVLRDRALPYRPFELSGSQRNSIDWYPGIPIGVLQVYGAKEEPTTITGMWKDKFLTSGDRGSAPAEVSSSTTEMIDGQEAISLSASAIKTARELVQVVDDIRRKGQEVEVTWLDQVRRGIIDRFSARWQTGHDVEWDITFMWVSQGESAGDIPMQSDSSDLGDLPNRVQGHVDEIVDDVAGLVPQAGDSFADINSALQEVGGELQRQTDELTDMVVSAAGVISAPGEAMRRTVGILDGLKMSAELLWEIATDTADGLALDFGAAQSFGKVLAQRGEVRERADAATRLRNLSARESARLLASIQTGSVRVFQARDGQDLRDVSRVYFGSPDEWRTLMVFNRLRSSELTAGQVVFVPSRPTEAEC